MNMHFVAETRLFTAQGHRKYVDAREARLLLAAAAKADRHTRLFCELLHYSGCRISEALAVSGAHVDTCTNMVVFRTLKRRRSVYRAVPIPDSLANALAGLAEGCAPGARLFPWSRMHGWRIISRLMAQAGIDGPQANPRGLRHAYGVNAITHSVPESMLQRWMGHASIRSTATYTFAMGPEERAMAARMWRGAQ